jgi:hypothetical protein
MIAGIVSSAASNIQRNVRTVKGVENDKPER